MAIAGERSWHDNRDARHLIDGAKGKGGMSLQFIARAPILPSRRAPDGGLDRAEPQHAARPADLRFGPCRWPAKIVPPGADDAPEPSLGDAVCDLSRPSTNTKSKVPRPHLDAAGAKMCKVLPLRPLRPPRTFGIDPRGACARQRCVGMDGA